MILHTKVCFCCDRVFLTRRHDALTCSDACRAALSRFRRKRRELRLSKIRDDRPSH